MKFYVVRMGDYVEFRVASRPPRAKVSKLTRVFKTVQRVTIPTDNSPFYKYVDKPANTKVTLKTVFYLGGRVLGTAKLNRFQGYPDAPRFGKRGILEVSEKLKRAVLRTQLSR